MPKQRRFSTRHFMNRLTSSINGFQTGSRKSFLKIFFLSCIYDMTMTFIGTHFLGIPEGNPLMLAWFSQVGNISGIVSAKIVPTIYVLLLIKSNLNRLLINSCILIISLVFFIAGSTWITHIL